MNLFCYNYMIYQLTMKRFSIRLLVILVGVTTSAPMVLAQRLTAQGKTTANETTSGVTSFFSTLWTKAPSWIAAMIVFACSFVFANIVKNKVVDRISEKLGSDDKDVLILIGRATYLAVLSVGVTISLKIGGIDLTAIIAAVGFGIGFALQDLVMNFIAGILILLNRQFTIGDFIKIKDTVGKVVEIQSRATILRALDGTRVIVPNADLFKNQVTSYTSNETRRIEIAVGVEYRTDLAHAQQIILEALKEESHILPDPEPAILLDAFADSSINFKVRFWVNSHSNWLKIKSDVIHSIKQHFDKEGIGIPFPIRTLVFDRETEGVVIPTTQLSPEAMAAKQAEREADQALLAEKIAASSERAKLIEDIKSPSSTATPHEEMPGAIMLADVVAKPVVPVAPAEVVVPAPVVGAPSLPSPAEPAPPVVAPAAPIEEIPTPFAIESAPLPGPAAA